MAHNAETTEWLRLWQAVQETMSEVFGRPVHSREAIRVVAAAGLPALPDDLAAALNRIGLPAPVLSAEASPADCPIGSLTVTVDPTPWGYTGAHGTVEMLSCWSRLEILTGEGQVGWECEFSGPQVFLAADQHADPDVRMAAGLIAALYRSWVWQAVVVRARALTGTTEDTSP